MPNQRIIVEPVSPVSTDGVELLTILERVTKLGVKDHFRWVAQVENESTLGPYIVKGLATASELHVRTRSPGLKSGAGTNALPPIKLIPAKGGLAGRA
jgi:hypothetical protein